ncbi:50S ribosomal protein L44e [Candidatus Micrarchaeota archaeon CG10_big_fil_rev_8_21_14_0_10_45_29]|nr:MAG: 50S ribosomal protein L44e [Candidatus Micrarchaeota archaeon CG10_big_fil_rev_8_21_14_0_10_45_29]
MKYPKKTRTYCPKCKKHTEHKAKLVSKGKNRPMAIGNRKHARKLKGRGGKRAGKVPVKKQGKRQTIVLLCPECKKKHIRTIGTRTKKKLEFI